MSLHATRNVLIDQERIAVKIEKIQLFFSGANALTSLNCTQLLSINVKATFLALYKKLRLQNRMDKKNENWSLGHYHCPFLQLILIVLLHKPVFFTFDETLLQWNWFDWNEKFKLETQDCIRFIAHSAIPNKKPKFAWFRLWYLFC